MSGEEIVNRVVPFSPVLSHITGVPPVVIESSVSEVGQLGKKVHVGVEETIENQEP